MKEAATTLLVMPKARRKTLLPRLTSLALNMTIVDDYHSARRYFAEGKPVDLVIVDLSLGDGNWCDVLRAAVECGVHARILVSAPAADEYLWSQVMWRGAYDILVEPFAADEVRRVVEGALYHMPASKASAHRATLHAGAGIPA